MELTTVEEWREWSLIPATREFLNLLQETVAAETQECLKAANWEQFLEQRAMVIQINEIINIIEDKQKGEE